RGLEAAVEAATAIGPASRALEGQPPDVRAAAVDSIRAALTRYQVGSVVALPGEIWIVSATNP
ncbi:MAG: SAM-dependent methyltransferase, partial [Gammaproteobacteria bacterium]|nr:SAM-dependent methyltransferase [Gammaproteobacteria bacterium]